MKANPTNMRSILIVIGFVMIVTAITTAGYVYQSFATDIFEKVIYAIFGVVFACLGAIFLPMSGLLWKAQHAILSFVCAVIWILCLFVIGTQTHLGFMAYAQNKTENSSASAQQAVKLKQSQYDSANTRTTNLEKYATVDLANEQTKLASLKTALETEQATLANCPRGYVKNCITPAKSSITALNGKITAVESTIANANGYLAALAARDSATSALTSGKATPSNSMDTVHPLFVSQSVVLGVDAKKMQSYFLAFSAVSFEALTAIVWLVVSLLTTATAAQSQQSMRVQQLPNDFESALRGDPALAHLMPQNEQHYLAEKKPIPNHAELDKPLEYKPSF